MKKNQINPIDKDKISENPHSIEYPHHVGSALIKPEDKGKIKGLSLSAMEQQTDMQLNQIYDQMQLLAEQAKKINKRKEISERIYQATYRFTPLINHIYYLYERNGEQVLSMIDPEQWKNSKSGKDYIYLASIKLLADHTWEIIHSDIEDL